MKFFNNSTSNWKNSSLKWIQEFKMKMKGIKLKKVILIDYEKFKIFL